MAVHPLEFGPASHSAVTAYDPAEPTTVLLGGGDQVRVDRASVKSGPMSLEIEVLAEGVSAVRVAVGRREDPGYTLVVTPGAWKSYTLPALFDVAEGSVSLWLETVRGQVRLRRLELRPL